MATFSTSFDQAWHRHEHFTLPNAPDNEDICIYAQRFTLQVEEYCRAVTQNPSHVSINHALLQVCKKYWEWFYVVPKGHRNRIDERGHRCIHTVFRETYENLKALELSLAPPILYIPAAPPPPQPVVRTFEGITIGEIVGDED